jgi:hypothetical protein
MSEEIPVKFTREQLEAMAMFRFDHANRECVAHAKSAQAKMRAALDESAAQRERRLLEIPWRAEGDDAKPHLWCVKLAAQQPTHSPYVLATQIKKEIAQLVSAAFDYEQAYRAMLVDLDAATERLTPGGVADWVKRHFADARAKAGMREEG